MNMLYHFLIYPRNSKLFITMPDIVLCKLLCISALQYHNLYRSLYGVLLLVPAPNCAKQDNLGISPSQVYFTVLY